MPFELQVALRYLLAKRRQVFISIISLVSTLGVTVGVMALIVALAMMTGLQGELQARILGSSAHVFVYKPAGITDYRQEVERLSKVPGVIGAAPAVLGKGLIAGLSTGFIAVKGIDAAMEPFDAAIMPTAPFIAPKIAAFAEDGEFARLNLLLLRNTMIGNFFDLCGISLPMSEAGAPPTGLMLLGRHDADRRLLRLGAAVEVALSA